MQPQPTAPSSIPYAHTPSSEPFALSPRRYDLDWLRIVAILTLLFYHTGMIYVSWGWHIQSAEHSQPMEEVMRWLHRWRMPLLFFISGAGTFFALKKRSFGSYARERVWRLFIPLVFGMFVIVPPQIYIEWLFRGRFSGSYADFYPEVLKFQAYHDGGTGGAFSWHHLWFICYLFFYSLLSIPFFRFLRTNTGRSVINGMAWLVAKPGGLMALVVPIIISQATLGLYFPDETHALVNDWPYFVNNLLLFWYGYLLVCSPGFTPQVSNQRRIFLGITICCTLILYGMRLFFMPDQINESPIDVFFDINSFCLTVASVVATIGYGNRYLNINKPSLPQLNEAVYPFYILHQTVIVLIGYYVLTQTTLGVYDGFLVVSLSSLAVCVAIYLLLIRPFTLTRVLFGMKRN